jgi:adenylosuccinate synthase
MANVVIVGAQWGDEGKAKITDMLAEQAQVVIRSQGGCNAGHTVSANGHTFKFHLLPSGMLYANKLCIVGPGTVIYPTVLMDEIQAIAAKGYNPDQLKVSNRAHVTLPFHIQQDKDLEAARCLPKKQNDVDGKIGTTGRGIGPTYMDKASRLGLRLHELYEPGLKDRLYSLLTLKKLPTSGLDALLAEVQAWADALLPTPRRYYTTPWIRDSTCCLKGRKGPCWILTMAPTRLSPVVMPRRVARVQAVGWDPAVWIAW